MGIKSLDELREIRARHSERTQLRHNSNEQDSEFTEILVGMATCGIAAGARETMNEIIRILKEKEISNVRVIPVGCMGFCQYEPLIQINMPRSNNTVYKNVKQDKVETIIESHIMNHTPVQNMVLDVINRNL